MGCMGMKQHRFVAYKFTLAYGPLYLNYRKSKQVLMAKLEMERRYAVKDLHLIEVTNL